jgi:hypothetical protein
MNVYQWLCVFAVPNLVFLFWQTIIGKKTKKKDEQIAARRAELERQQDEIRRQNETMEAQNKATMLGVQALLRDRLLQSFKHYIAQGYADYGDRDNVRNMYEQYEALGPNSVMSDLYEQFTELPIQL